MTRRKWTIYGAIATILTLAALAKPAIATDEDSWMMLGGSDGPVTVNVHGFSSIRYSYNDGGDVASTRGVDDPNTRLSLSGSISDYFEYRVSGEWTNGTDFDLVDAWGSGRIAGTDIRFGQFRTAFLKEWDVYQADTLGADRSIVSYTFGQGRSQGVELGTELGPLHLHAAYTDGFNTENGGGFDNSSTVSGRADIQLSDGVDFGAAVAYNDLDSFDYWTYTLDAGFVFQGFDVTAAFVGVNGDSNILQDWASTFSAAYQCTDDLQAFVQYEYGVLNTVSEDLNIASVGVNYDFNDNVTFTTDAGYSFNGIAGGWDLSDTGWETTSDGGEYLIRGQFVLEF